jgi:hypothetical protein
VVSASASIASAQADVDRATARQLGTDGAAALASKDYKTAEQDFRKADSIIHAPTLLLGLARALAGQGRLVEAQEAYRRIVREGAPAGSPAVFAQAVADASKELDSISSRVGTVNITVVGSAGEPVAGARVTWDGAAINPATLGVKRPADPGSHVIHATAEGYKVVDLKVDVPAGGAVEERVTLSRDASAMPGMPSPAANPAEPPTAPAPDAQPSGGSWGPWPWVAFGVGGAGLATGTVAGILAISKRSSIIGECPGGVCSPAQQSDVSSYNTLGLVSTIGFVVGGAGAAAGVVLLLLPPPRSSTATAGLHVAPLVGPGSLGALGTF